MSGHSKWKNIMHKKEKTDAQRAKIFTKIGKEITVAVKAGGPDPEVNAKLAQLIQKAKQNNVPNDNIERTIKKASSSDAASLEEMRYEGKQKTENKCHRRTYGKCDQYINQHILPRLMQIYFPLFPQSP